MNKNILKVVGILFIGALLIFSLVAVAATSIEITLPLTTKIGIDSRNSETELHSLKNILWDNWIENFNEGFPTQWDEAINFDVYAADDFIFDENTDVYMVLWQGGYFHCNDAQGPKDYHFNWNITFFEDYGNGYHPGDVYAGPFTFLDSDVRKGEERLNDTTYVYGSWACNMTVTLPSPVTFNADTKYWITIYGLGEVFPQSAWLGHNESLGGILLHEAVLKSQYYYNLGTMPSPDWVNGSHPELFGYPIDLNFQLLGPVPLFDVTISKGLGFTVTIENIGTANATNVEATITANGGLILLGKTKTVSVENIAVGAIGTAKSILLGIGNIDIEVYITCNEGITSYENASGFLFLILIL